MIRQILHIDMDAFFAAVEQKDHPQIQGKPVVVGIVHRGVVAAASYEARRFGVRSAMSMREALQRCPQAVVMPPRHGRYAEVSEQIFGIFARYTPLVEGLSLDEAFLDVTASQRLFGDGVTIAKLIKHAIAQEVGLIASAGIAPCKFVAKIASDIRKPNGLLEVKPNDVLDFLAPLPIERMWGVGPKAAAQLRERGLTTIGQLRAVPSKSLEALLGQWGLTVHALAHGMDDRPVEPDVEAKSVGAEDTFDADIVSRDALEQHILGQSQRVARRLVRAQQCGQVVVLKIKFADFKTITRRMTLHHPIADTDSIFVAAKELLQRVSLNHTPVRLTGVAVTQLWHGEPPRQLFPDPAQERRRRVEDVTHAITTRFGGNAVTRATLLHDPVAASDDDNA